MNNSCKYPDYFLRGITSKDFIDKYGNILAGAFHFNGHHYNDNKYDEISINWYDNDEALEQMKELKKENSDSLKYINGIVRVPTNEMKKISKMYKNMLSYERKPIEDNEYHGNLLLHEEVVNSGPVKRMIESALALSVDKLLEYNENDNNWTGRNIKDY